MNSCWGQGDQMKQGNPSRFELQTLANFSGTDASREEAENYIS